MGRSKQKRESEGCGRRAEGMFAKKQSNAARKLVHRPD